MPKRDEAAQRREEQNLRNLEAGGVPVSAEERLRAQSSRPKPFFVTNLSVNEFSMVRKTGYHAAGQVMGSSIYHIGWQFMPTMSTWSWQQASQELDTLTHAHLEARSLALSRLQWETRLLGAHGVVGVRLDRKMYEWGANLVEFSVMGTAIYIDGQPPTDTPFLSDLSGEEFYQLWEAGFEPVAFAYGNCFWYEVPSWNTRTAQNTLFGGMANQELVDFTQAVHRTRDLAMNRMTNECTRAGATGVVGVTVSRELKTREVEVNKVARTDLMVHMQITGTAIRERPLTTVPKKAGLIMSLADLPLRSADTSQADTALEGTTRSQIMLQ